MPLLRKNQELEKVTLDEDVLKDYDEVYYCEISKEIFRNYEDYFNRVMILNSTVWTCALTSRPNLTYSEALDSEKAARRVLRKFPYELKAPLVFVASLTKRRGISDLVDDVFAYISTRFFREETVNVLLETEQWCECEVLSIVYPVESQAEPVDPLSGGIDDEPSPVDPATVQYKLRRIDVVKKKLQEPFFALGKNIRRTRAILTKDKLKLFMKHCVEFNDSGLLSIKATSYAKYVTDGGVSRFSDFWVGAPPVFVLSKTLQIRIQKQEQDKEKADNKETKKGNKETKGSKLAATKDIKSTKKDIKKKESSTSIKKVKKKDVAKTKEPKEKTKAKLNKSDTNKQPSISNYFSKNDGKSSPPSAATAAPPTAKKISNDQLQRIRKEKEDQEAAEKQRQVEERDRLNLLVATAIRSFNRTGEDLELQDQRMLPHSKSLKTLIPPEFMGDAMFVLEFVYSFAPYLESTDKFPKGYSLDLIQRALICEEVAGPLSDTIQVLLGTIFSLHVEEAAEVHLQYVQKQYFDDLKESIDPDVRDATLSTSWTNTFLSMNLVELPMDATTVSELLRLHLLTSGAAVEDECAKWRYQQRGGYRHEDDPGLILRQAHPHILGQLAEKTVYQLEKIDILRILMCLINQILSYSTIRDTIEERLNDAHQARHKLRGIVATERRRETALHLERKALNDTLKKAIAALTGTESEKAELQIKLTRTLDADLLVLEQRAEKAKYEYSVQVQDLRREIFSFQLQLGMDRAHRTYWMFESLPAVFIVTPGQSQVGDCLPEAPIKQYPALARCTDANRNAVIKQMTLTQMSNSDKENKVENHDGSKSIKSKSNGVVKEDDAMEVVETTTDLPVEMLMCTGLPDTCPVHGAQIDWNWSFIDTEQELDALIASLNTRGVRERFLKEQLETDRELILHHIKNADSSKLSISEENRDAHMQTLMAMSTYAKANMGFPDGASVPSVMEGSLVDLIVTMERRVTEGHLGKVNVGDLDKWRDALTFAKDDEQSDDLCWGPDSAFNKDNRLSNANASANPEEIINYVDPGACIQDKSMPIHTEVVEMRERIFYIARSLLQVAQAIDQQFLRAPFGVQNRTFKTNPAVLAKGRQAMLMWQVSLMNAQSYAQVFLHYAILDDAIIWSRSSLNAACRMCRRRVMPEKMLLCDGCNAGRHLFCFKPKLSKVPEGQWFCENCKPREKEPVKKGKRIRKIFAINMDSDDEMLLGADDVDTLRKLNKKERRLDQATEWKSSSDEDEPTQSESDEPEDTEDMFVPEKKAPVGPKPTKVAAKRKIATPKVALYDSDSEEEEKEIIPEKRSRRIAHKPKAMISNSDEDDDDMNDDDDTSEDVDKDDDDTDFEEPRRPSRRSSTKRATTKRSSAVRTSSRRSTDDDDAKLTNGHRLTSRRSRRTDDDNDNLLLDTVGCYELLGDMAKHEDVWPFDRPVNKVDVPDYYKVIQRPMDLAKIKSKLNLGEYRTNYDIMNDIQLIFSNCDLYNNNGSEIYNSGANLERFVRDRCTALNLPFKASDMLADYNKANVTKSSSRK